MREQLEAALRADFSRENLMVYGDYLLAEGDPRGEMIAIDAKLAAGPDPELERKKKQLLAREMGQILGRLPQSTFAFGFIEELVLNDAWHGSPGDVTKAIAKTSLGPYIRSIRLWGGASFYKYALPAVAAGPTHHWVGKLKMSQWSDAAVPRSPLCTRKTTAALIAAVPNLHTLELKGRNFFGTFDHPGVKTWTLSDADSIKQRRA